jgi:hypothetical protein
MKYLYKVVIAPMFRLIWAIIYTSLILLTVILSSIIVSIWHLRFKRGFEDENVFGYVTGDGMTDKYSTVYKSPFHWALNIGGLEQLNRGCIITVINHAGGKSSFKDYIEITKRDIKVVER